MKLYEISQELRDLLESEELTDEQLAAVEKLELSLDDKINGLCTLINETWEDSNSLASESARLRERSKVFMNKVDRLKDYLKFCLEQLGTKAHKTKLWTIRIQSNPPAAKATLPVEDLQAEYRREVTKVEVNKEAAIAYWKMTGQCPPGFEISTGSHLRIS